jgi:hypothetical protein
MEKAKQDKAVFMEKTEERKLTARRQKQVDMAIDYIEQGKDPSEYIDKMIDLDMSPTMIRNAIKTGIKNRLIPADERFMYGTSSAPRSNEQKRKYLNMMEYVND